MIHIKNCKPNELFTISEIFIYKNGPEQHRRMREQRQRSISRPTTLCRSKTTHHAKTCYRPDHENY